MLVFWLLAHESLDISQAETRLIIITNLADWSKWPELQTHPCDHQKSKLRVVAGAEGFWVAELRVRQLKIGSKSCFDKKCKLRGLHTWSNAKKCKRNL